MISLKQKELAEWQEKNFGGTNSTCKPEWCLLGMTEEVGALCHLVLKRQQKIREAGTMDYSEWKEKVADDIADAIIYGIQLGTTLGIDVEHALEETLTKVLRRVWE